MPAWFRFVAGSGAEAVYERMSSCLAWRLLKHTIRSSSIFAICNHHMQLCQPLESLLPVMPNSA
mgnify:CR=1 FL=1